MICRQLVIKENMSVANITSGPSRDCLSYATKVARQRQTTESVFFSARFVRSEEIVKQLYKIQKGNYVCNC